MPKGKLGYDKWYVSDMGGNFYLAERTIDGKSEQVEFSAHCLSCAKNDILAKRGGQVDLRGTHLTICGAFARSMQFTVLEEENES